MARFVSEYSQRIRSFIEKATGLSLTHNEKWESFLRSFSQTELANFEKEWERWDGAPEKLSFASDGFGQFLQKIYQYLNISETYFYRDPEQLDTILEEVLVPQISKFTNTPFKVWSAGCSRGEEVYTLAILFQIMKETRFPQFTFDILGTDLQTKSIEWAKRARYETYSIRSRLPKSFLRYLDSSSGMVTVDPEIQARVRFRVGNLLEDTKEQHHMVVCRNVLIYVAEQQKVKMLAQFQKALFPGGILLTGHSELGSLIPPFFQVFHIPKKTSYYLLRPEPRSEIASEKIEAVVFPKEEKESNANFPEWDLVGDGKSERSELSTDPADSQEIPKKQIQSWRKALYLNPEDLEAYYEISSLYWELGDRAQAKTYQSRALVLIKNDPQIVDRWKKERGWKPEWEAFLQETL